MEPPAERHLRTPSVVLPSPLLDRLHARAREAYPEECCGVLVGSQEGASLLIQREIACANAVEGPDRRRRFAIHPRVLLDVMQGLRDRDEGVVGFYHSHPDGDARLSRTDLGFVALWPDTVWLVLPVAREGAGEARAWWLPSAASPGEAPREMPVRMASATAGS